MRCPLFHLAVITAPAIVHAQQTPANVPITPTVEVRGSASSYDRRRDDTVAKIVLKHEEIVKHGDTNLLDVLKRIPGITVTGSAGRGSEIRMQGLGGGYTQVLIDGERAPRGFAIDTLAPDLIERIEVLRAANVEYSTQAIAGTINVVLKKAARTAERNLKIGYEISRDTRIPSANLQLSDRTDRFSYSLGGNLVHNRFNGDVPGIEHQSDPNGRTTLLRTTPAHENGNLTTYSLVPRLNWKLEGGDAVALESVVNINRFRVNVHAPTLTEIGAPPPYPQKETRMTNDNASFRSDLRWTRHLESGTKLDMKLGASGSRTGNTVYRDARGNPNFELLTRKIDSEARDRGVNSTGKVTIPLREGHALTFGWNGAINTRDDVRTERDYERPMLGIPGGDERSNARVTHFALFGQDEWEITPRWSVYMGTRWEGIRIRINGDALETTHSRSNVFSPVLQTLYKLSGTPKDQLRLAISRTYKAPSMQSLIPAPYTTINNSQVEPDVQGNPGIKPELALGLDAAYEHYWKEGAMLSASVSTRRIDDYTRYLVSFDGRRWISQLVNIGQARTHSLQLEAKFPLTALFDNAPALEVHANIARNWSSVDAVPGPDNRLGQQTPLSANLGADYTRNALTMGANFSFQAGGRVRLSENQTAYLNVQRDLELYALWKINPVRQLRVTATNVLGQDFVNERSYTGIDGVLRNRTTNVHYASLRARLETKF